MDSRDPSTNDGDDQLDPPLREVVQRIAESQPPEDLVARCVKLAKRQRPDQRPEPAERTSPRAATWLIAAAVAASIIAAVVYLRPVDDSREVVQQKPRVIQEEDPFDTEWVNESPTLWAYHQTAQQSPEDLDDLLETHARDFRVSGPAMSLFGS
jgi:hypothetical protein